MPEVVELLRRERAQAADPDGYIFPSIAARAGHQMRMHIAFERVVRSADLDPRLVTPHTLRRTAITSLVMAGVDLPTIMQISGHKHTRVLLRYVHLFGSHVDRAVAILSRLPSDRLSGHGRVVACLALRHGTGADPRTHRRDQDDPDRLRPGPGPLRHAGYRRQAHGLCHRSLQPGGGEDRPDGAGPLDRLHAAQARRRLRQPCGGTGRPPLQRVDDHAEAP
jgi:hypothetical protein